MRFIRKTVRLALTISLALSAFSCGEMAESAGEATDAGKPGTPSLDPMFETPEALTRAILKAFETEDGEALRSYALTKEQFRLYVWSKLPSSRPERGVPFEYGWGDLHEKSHNALLRNFARFKGRKLELLGLRFEDGVTDYGTYKVHRDARVQVRTEGGEKRWLDLFGSVMEWQGKYKLFSYVTD